MNRYFSSAAMVLGFAAAPLAHAQQSGPSAATTDEDIIVTATRAPSGLPRDQIGGSVTVLSSDDLGARQTQIVADILRDVPGVEVNRSGGVGGLTDIRIRGAEANHTLVLIDGMDAGDVFQGQFDFATLLTDDVAHIEVLRGPQSALYGSDAIGGVIQYFMATGAEAPGARAHAEYGSFNTAQISARIAGVNGPLDWAVAGNVYDSDGTPNVPGGSRDLGFDQRSLTGRFGLKLSPDLSITAVIRSNQATGDFNEDLDFDGLNDDSPGDHYDVDTTAGLIRVDLSTFNGAWTHALILQRTESQRLDAGTFFTSASAGERNKASYVTTLNFGGADFDQHLTGAIDYKDETLSSNNFAGDRTLNQTGVLLDYDALIGQNLGLGFAVRHDDNSRFEAATTYRAQASYAFTSGTRIRAAAGSGIKDPTTVELFGFFGAFIGNPNLTPEKSHGWEAGVDQSLFDRHVLVGVTYFDTELNDEISSQTISGVSRPINVDGKSTRTGVEVFAQAHFGRQWSLDVSYTNLDAQQPDGTPELRRADNIASANLSWRTPDDRVGLNLNVRYNGKQHDDAFLAPFFIPAPVTLDAFTLVNIGADWKLSDKIDLYGRVENALDQSYQEVFDFATPGRAVYVGLRASL